MKTGRHPVLGAIHEDLVSDLLGTGYFRFEADGIGGLVKFTDDRLDILAVLAKPMRRGAFRRLIHEACVTWRTVCVWQVWNPAVASALIRYGFHPEVEIQGMSSDVLKGFRYDR